MYQQDDGCLGKLTRGAIDFDEYHIHMLLAIDGIAERYGMLPSVVVDNASTFDLYVLNAAQEWRNREQAIAQSGATKKVPHLTQAQLQEMMENHKRANK